MNIQTHKNAFLKLIKKRFQVSLKKLLKKSIKKNRIRKYNSVKIALKSKTSLKLKFYLYPVLIFKARNFLKNKFCIEIPKLIFQKNKANFFHFKKINLHFDSNTISSFYELLILFSPKNFFYSFSFFSL